MLVRHMNTHNCEYYLHVQIYSVFDLRFIMIPLEHTIITQCMIYTNGMITKYNIIMTADEEKMTVTENLSFSNPHLTLMYFV